MRIFIIAEDEPFLKPTLFEQLIFKRKEDIIGISLIYPDAKKQIITYFRFFGLMDFLKFSFSYLYFRFYRDSLYQLAKKHNIKIYPIENINKDNYADFLKELDLDIIIICVNERISKKILDIPKFGCLGIHSSLLPKYKGMYPIFWALLNNEKAVGSSIFILNERFDDGDIVGQVKVPVGENDTMMSLYKKCFKKAEGLLIEVLDKIENNKVEVIKSIDNQSSYYSSPKKEDTKKFKKMGKRFI